ncbi:MAG: hypothetical protein ACI4UJ_05560 [Candidatus Cryptobacteroides sp.]
MKWRKTREDKPSDEYRTCPDDWKFFLKAALTAVGCFVLGRVVLIPALRLESRLLGFVTYLLWACAVFCVMAFILGLVLEIRMRRTHRRLSKENRKDDTQ